MLKKCNLLTPPAISKFIYVPPSIKVDPAKFLYMKSPGIAEELITVSIKSSKVVNYVSSNLEKNNFFFHLNLVYSPVFAFVVPILTFLWGGVTKNF
jgi:hypothetical protein